MEVVEFIDIGRVFPVVSKCEVFDELLRLFNCGYWFVLHKLHLSARGGLFPNPFSIFLFFLADGIEHIHVKHTSQAQ